MPMNRISPVALVLLGLAGCSGQSPEEGQAAQEEDLAVAKPYLALGDSVAFGYNPVDAQNDPTNLKAFVGYPELTLVPYPIANAACEGETSGSFIDTSAPDIGCKSWRAAGDAMHVQYTSASESQLQFALDFLAKHPKTATVSLGIGANDLNYVADVTNCEASQIPGTIANAARNIGTIAGAIRQSGYTGQLVLVTYYAEQYSNTSDLNLQAVVGLDEAMVQVAQAYPQLNLSIAKSFSTFGAIANAAGGGDSCKAGLLYKLADGTCDKHPSRFGQAVLAAAVAAAVPASKIDLSASPPQF